MFIARSSFLAITGFTVLSVEIKEIAFVGDETGLAINEIDFAGDEIDVGNREIKLSDDDIDIDALEINIASLGNGFDNLEIDMLGDVIGIKAQVSDKYKWSFSYKFLIAEVNLT